jgi:hypothetical protein
MSPAFGRGFVLALLTIVVSIGAATAGCGKLRAATQPDLPQLDTPPPPPRVITPVQVDAPGTASEQTDDPSPPSRQPQRPAPARTDPKPAPPPRADREPEREGAKPGESRPSRSLQTGDAGSVSERAVRDELARASAGLQRIDYRGLSPNLKEQYEVAKRFIQQSEEALKAGNLVYASTLADKAAEIAEVLRR